MNDKIKLDYPNEEIPEDKRFWKYYLNISGVKHWSDETIFITSLDTLEEIEFNKLVLQNHPTTKEEYSMNSRYYLSLVNKYPNMTLYIKGTLFPCELEQSIQASDGEILAYDKSLVEPQEQSLIINLQDSIYRYLANHDSPSFGLVDDLFPAVSFASLIKFTLSKLKNLRERAERTNEVHSYFVKQYLDSHYDLGKYIPYMTLEQMLYLYRNIKTLS